MPALVDFYDARFRDQPVRAWPCCCNPCASARGRGMAVVQVAETLELRETLVRKLLRGHAVAPAAADGRDRGRSPCSWCSARPGHVRQLGRGDRRGARPTTCRRSTRPTRRASCARWSMRPPRSWAGCSGCSTTRSASCATAPTSCARRWRCSRRRCSRRGAATSRPSRRLSRDQSDRGPRGPRSPTRCSRWPRWSSCASSPSRCGLDSGEVARQIVLDLSPLIADKALDFEPRRRRAACRCAPTRWMLQELTRNLLHNAIKQRPPGARAVGQAVRARATGAALDGARQQAPASRRVAQRLFAPFSAPATARSGSGLGLRDLPRDRAGARRPHRARQRGVAGKCCTGARPRRRRACGSVVGHHP